MKYIISILSLLLYLNYGTVSSEGTYKEGEKANLPVETNERDPRILLAYYKSTTVLSLTTVTKAVLSTCYSISTSATLCNGRRRKKRTIPFSEDPKLNL
ncbi:hypothetical protein Avbf_04085 [Armadillidium vulgare]|nr:hypothetical protein Avbf_04085 [Armadillidium vulgare]